MIPVELPLPRTVKAPFKLEEAPIPTFPPAKIEKELAPDEIDGVVPVKLRALLLPVRVKDAKLGVPEVLIS